MYIYAVAINKAIAMKGKTDGRADAVEQIDERADGWTSRPTNEQICG
jgi:hypothetical protein